MPKYFDVARARADGVSEAEIQGIMKKLNLQPKPATAAPEATPTAQVTPPAPTGMSVDQATLAPAPVAEPPQDSLLGKIGKGIVGIGKAAIAAPVRFGKALGEAAGTTMNQGNQEKIDQQYLDTANSYTQKAIELNKAGRKEEATQMFQLAQQTLDKTSTEAKNREQAAQKGVEDTVKGGVGTAALFVPGGSTPVGRVAAGAVSGGMSGFGASETGKELESTVGGAAVGGAVAGAGELFGAVLNKIKANKVAGAATKAVEDTSGLSEKVINPQVKASPFYLSDKNKLMNTAKEIGIGATDNSTSALNKLEQGFTKSSTEIEGLLTNAPALKQDTLLEKVIGQLDNTDFTPGDPTYEKLLKTQLGKIEKLGTDMSPTEIYSMKSELGDTLSPVFKKIEKGMPLTKSEEIRASMYYALKDALDTVSPEVAKINNLQHDMYVLSEGLVKSEKGKVPLSFKLPIGTDVPLPVNSQQVDIAGQVAKNAVNKVGETGMSAASAVGGTPIVRNAAMAKGVQMMNQTKPEELTQEPLQTPVGETPNLSPIGTPPGVADGAPVGGGEQGSGMATASATADSATGYTVKELATALSKAQMDGNKKAVAELQKLYDIEKDYQKTTKASATQGKAEKQNKSFTNSIDQLEKLYFPKDGGTLSVGNTTVGVGGAMNKAGAVVKKNTNQEFADRLNSYKQMASLAAGIINQARQAGTLNAGEFETMMANMPNEYTSEKAAKNWFANIRTMLGNSQPIGTGMTVDEAVQLQEGQ